MVDESRIDDVESALHDAYFTTMLTLRDAQDPSKLYLNVKKFQSVFPGRKPDFVPAKASTTGNAGEGETGFAAAAIPRVRVRNENRDGPSACGLPGHGLRDAAAGCCRRAALPGRRHGWLLPPGVAGAADSIGSRAVRRASRCGWDWAEWAAAALFAVFALRAFCWLVFYRWRQHLGALAE